MTHYDFRLVIYTFEQKELLKVTILGLKKN
jgi:hypothetical protein